MAKKKKRVTRKTSRRVTKKRKQTTTSKRAPSNRSASQRPGGTSVDTLLKRFAKERSAQESQLEALRKKKEDLEEKSRKLREQIAKLSEQETKCRDELSQLDAHRDREVSQLLANLGVRLGGATHTATDNQVHESAANAKSSRDRVPSSLAGRRDNLN